MRFGYAISPGSAHPLGATWDGTGTNFAICSEHATRVELCFFDSEQPAEEMRRIDLIDRSGPVWHCYILGVYPGAIYGYRIHGPYRPDDGHRFNPAKLLVDPYARALTGSVDWHAPVHGYRRGHDGIDPQPDVRDDAHGVPKSVVIDPSFDWQGDVRPNTPWSRTLIYEAHVKGLTKLHPEIPEPLRGTYAGFTHPSVIDYLRRLGATAVEFLPLHAFIDDEFLVHRGLRNYWGYNTLGFFAPEGRYSSTGDRGGQVTEFKEMVRALHAAGIEVLLDVVFNHTAEAGHMGPTLSFRGIDNQMYYLLSPREPSDYVDVTGTGNTLNVSHPQVLKMVMDSLRYWVQEMHVDGFRFDLAPALARQQFVFSAAAAFLHAIHQDPVLAQVKLIAEPWDLGEGGYHLAKFPHPWSEWNDRYRDTVRRFWRRERGALGELGFRLTGSADLFQPNHRGPTNSINFVTAHDGFTLRDLVSYERKHNAENGEHNRDGSDYNLSWNSGVEGPTGNPEIVARRHRQIKNLLATLLLSQGVPMIVAGDEIGRTQRGNNNAYCQDNETSWLSWEHDDTARDLLEFTRRAVQLRMQCPMLRRTSFYTGQRVSGGTLPDITWHRPDGKQMSSNDWADADRHAIAFRLVAPGIESSAQTPGPAALFVAMNADATGHRFQLPRGANGNGNHWECILWTPGAPKLSPRGPGARFVLPAESLCVLQMAFHPEAAG